MIDFAHYQFQPVIKLPPGYEIYDFTAGYDPERTLLSPFGIGRYNEDRRGMYDADLFQNAEGARTIHMGIDIGAPVGTPVYAFYEGEIFMFGNNQEKGDYGFTLITKHEFAGEPLYALHGHLSAESIHGKTCGQKIVAGEMIASLGDRHENGGWNPHLHFQLCLEEPQKCDLPGVVNAAQRDAALKTYPNPLLVLGPLY